MGKRFFMVQDASSGSENPDIELESSTCTGETIIGIRNRKTGKLENAVLVQSQKDIEAYKREHRIPK